MSSQEKIEEYQKDVVTLVEQYKKDIEENRLQYEAKNKELVEKLQAAMKVVRGTNPLEKLNLFLEMQLRCGNLRYLNLCKKYHHPNQLVYWQLILPFLGPFSTFPILSLYAYNQPVHVMMRLLLMFRRMKV